MRAIRWILLLLGIGAILPSGLSGQVGTHPVPVVFHPDTLSRDLPYAVQVWEDPSGQADLAAALVANFQPFTDSLQATFSPGAALWGAVSLWHPGPDSSTWILNLGIRDSVTWYRRSGDGWEQRLGGTSLPLSERDISVGNRAMFRLRVGSLDTVQMVFRVTGPKAEVPNLSFQVISDNGLRLFRLSLLVNSVGFVGLFQSVLLIMLLYNLMIFLTTRDLTYLWYACYLLSLVGALWFDTSVRSFPSLGFNQPHWNSFFAGLMLYTTSLWYFLFGRAFLNTPEIMPAWDRWIRLIIAIRVLFTVVVLILELFTGASWALAVNRFVLLGEILFLLVWFVQLARIGGGLVWFFIAGSGIVFLFGFMQLVLRDFFANQFLTFLMFLGSVLIEILIFSLGLGYKVRKNQRDKLAAERVLNEELTKVNTAFGRFVPHEFLQNLGRANATDVLLGDQVEKEVTVFFSDIRAYTTLSEQMTPKENFDFLNGYLGRVGPIIQQEGGFVNQYYGDGIMALFMGSPDDALRASVRIQQAILAYNEERQQKGRRPIEVGIGLHTGSLMMGIIGDTLRMEAGVVSDTVNTAARMEGLTKHYGVRILLSETTRAGLDGTYLLRSLGKVLVKGRVTPMQVFECAEGDPPADREAKLNGLPQHEAALQQYFARDFEAAIRTWQAVLAQGPDDPVVQRFLTAAQTFLAQGVPEDWRGVEVMQIK